MKKLFKKRISLFLILFTILMFNPITLNVEAASPITKEDGPSLRSMPFVDPIDIDVDKSGKKIIVTCDPLICDSFQVWLNYDNNSFLLKEYDDESSVVDVSYFNDKVVYTWNIRDMNINDSINNIFRNTKSGEIFSIYVKCKDFALNNNFSKTFFYVNNRIREFNLFTSNDVPELCSQSIYDFIFNSDYKALDYLALQSKLKFDDQLLQFSDFPAVARVNDEFFMLLYSNKNAKKYSIEVIGDEYSSTPTILCTRRNVRYVKWMPNKTGNFKIVVKDENSNIVMTKKLYVNSANDQYAEISNLNADIEDKSVTATLSNSFPSDTNEVQMKFTVSDPGIWSRTVKNYGQYGNNSLRQGEDYLIKNKENGQSKKNKLYFHDSTYKVTSYIKYPQSLEYDDAKAITVNFQNNNKANHIYLELVHDENSNTFTAIAYDDPKHEIKHMETSELEYAFIVRDYNGFKLAQTYGHNNTFQWKSPEKVKSGNYTIYAKVRFKNDKYNGNIHNYDPLSLPNSYEAQDSVEIKNEKLGNISITSVNIDCVEAGNTVLEDHKIHTIDIATNRDDICSNNRLQYRVYSVHDGVMRLLQGYTPNNLISFYPQSKGEYKLIVLVKDLKSGAYEDKKEIVVNVQ